MANFFINRPIFAWVLAIIVMLVGSFAVKSLPVAAYPKLAPPTVRVVATYPGASAKTMEDTVVQVIEQRMNGIDNLDYIASNSNGAGVGTVVLTFKQGTNPDIAQVQVQNKLQLAMPLLPVEVQQQGVSVSKSSAGYLLIAALYSEDGSMSNIDVGNYISTYLQDPISRVNGVGEVQVLGTKYAMRVWMDPEKLASYNMTPLEVRDAARAQNVQITAGQLGGAPSTESQRMNFTIMAQSKFQTVEQFQNILLKVTESGAQVRMKDVARVEMGGENYNVTGAYIGMPGAAIGVAQAPGANALETADAIKAQLAELEKYFPPGLKMSYPYDLTPFIKISINEVYHTLFEAIILVFLVMLLFLQSWRATLIPMITVPVVLLGTFTVIYLAGFSINMLTMFGLVLAMGLLVDDAIIVVENVERLMHEEGLGPIAATRKAMSQITGALIGVALVLGAVFVPAALMGGSTGAIYRQFTLTLVTAMGLSVIVAIVLTPALCSTMLKPVQADEESRKNFFFRAFNRVFDKISTGYQKAVIKILPKTKTMFVLYAAIVAGVIYILSTLPSAFLPDEDQGFFVNIVNLPVGSTRQQTEAVLNKMVEYYTEHEQDAVESMFHVAGFSWAGQGQNVGQMFVQLKDWDQRKKDEHQVQAVIQRSMGFFQTINEAMIFSLNPSSIPELGQATGFDLQLQDFTNQGHEALMAARASIIAEAAKHPEVVVAVRPNGMDDTPMYQVNINQERASALGLNLSDVYATLSAAFASSYTNDFIDQGRVKKVYIQAEAQARMQPDDLKRWHVRNRAGEMVPFSAFSSAEWIYGSPKLERYNGNPSIQIQGSAAPGRSTGDAMQFMADLVDKLPDGFGYSWTGMSLEEQRAGNQAGVLYVLSILVVFLCLAALYESWSIPFAVILVVPLGVLGAMLAARLFGLSNDVYFQVGLLTTIGLAAKNAILIVEFAKEEFDKGKSLAEAALAATQLRFRPIIMTSMAFFLGVLPLALSTGAGAASRNAIGIGVAGGLLAATFLVIFFVPLFFVCVLRWFKTKPAVTHRQDS